LNSILEGAAALRLGDAEASSTAFDAALTAFEGRPEASVLTFGAAAAHAESGSLDRALSMLDALAADNLQLAPVASLQAAQLIDAYGEPGDALDAYRQTLSAHAGLPGDADVQNRIVQLEIELGVEPLPAAAEEGEDSADEGDNPADEGDNPADEGENPADEAAAGEQD
jgi:hypothetical protein